MPSSGSTSHRAQIYLYVHLFPVRTLDHQRKQTHKWFRVRSLWKRVCHRQPAPTPKAATALVGRRGGATAVFPLTIPDISIESLDTSLSSRWSLEVLNTILITYCSKSRRCNMLVTHTPIFSTNMAIPGVVFRDHRFLKPLRTPAKSRGQERKSTDPPRRQYSGFQRV